MDFPSTFLLPFLVLFTTLLIFLKIIGPKNPRSSRLPPGPTGWPIFGNMFDLGSMPHRAMAGLREQYGPVVWLRFGAINSMVILSAKSATEFFKNHDLNFADRTVTETMRAHDYHRGSVALAPYGSYWRLLRRLVTVDMVVVKKINETAGVRRKCVDDMLTWLGDEARRVEGDGARGIHVARFVFLATFNLLGNLMLSRDLFDPRSERGSEFFNSMMGLMEWSGHANLADFFPWLKRIDPQRLRRRMERDLGNALGIASGFVKERVEQVKVVGDGERKKDFLDVLLEFQGNGKDEPSKISDRDINIFILEIFLAGSETTSSTVEWALTELLLNPAAMAEVKAELARVIGLDRKVEEVDIDNLPFLQAVTKETMRLHPPIPLLVPRKAIKDTTFMGYEIPQDTQVFVNCWSIGRDPEVWDEPLVFKPERFLGSNVDYKGQNFELIPFGAGRRMCAGVPLAHRMLHLLLGSLLHKFDWELEGGVTKETMDMRDRMGVTMRKYESLMAIPKISPKSQ